MVIRLRDIWLLATLLTMQAAHGAEYIRSQTPIPGSIEELQTPLDVSLEKKERPVRKIILDETKRRLERKPSWLRDLTLDFNMRGYYFKRINRSDSIDEALTLGGELAMVTGKFADLARLGFSYYGSYGVYAPEDRGGTLLLGPNQENLGVLGQAYLELGDPDKFGVRLYRQTLELPYLNKRDNRMIPNTFEAIQAGNEGTGRDFVLGHVAKIKRRATEDFVPMSEAAGAPDSDNGVTVAGFKLDLGEHTNFGAFNNYGWDTYNTVYVEGAWIGPVAHRRDLRVSAQFTDQRSVGDALVGDFKTNAFGLGLAADRHGMLFKLSYTQTDRGGTIRNPWGGSPSFNSMMLENFSRAGEKSLRLGVSWTGKQKRSDWSGVVNVIAGWDAIDADTGVSLPDVTEYDLTVDYKPVSGKYKDFWLRLRAAYADFANGEDRRNVRVILNYPFHFL